MAQVKTEKTISWWKWKRLSPREAWIFFLRAIVLPFTQSLVIFIISENMDNHVNLFFIIWLVSFGFVMVSYALVKFKPLRNGNFKKEIGTKIIYITFCSLIYTFSFVTILSTFMYGQDLPIFSYDPTTMVLSVYIQKVNVFILMWFASWIISTAVAKFIFKV